MRKSLKKCHIRSLSVFAFLLTLTVGFQNFTAIPLERLKLARFKPHVQQYAWARNEGRGDIRDIAPRRPASLDEPVIAAPMEGHNLESITQDWAKRQANLLTGGREEVLLKEVNSKINGQISRAFSNDEEEPTRGPASIAPQDAEVKSEPILKFTSINRLQVGLPIEANLSCAVQGSNVQVDLSRTLGERVNVNLRYDTSNNSNTVRLHYTW